MGVIWLNRLNNNRSTVDNLIYMQVKDRIYLSGDTFCSIPAGK